MLNIVAGTKATPGADTYLVQRSLRFRSGASAYLSRTFSTPTSSTIFTFSAWVKKGKIAAWQGLFTKTGSGDGLWFDDSTGAVRLILSAAASSTAVFRDPSSWYHVVWSKNGTSNTIYINNVSVITLTANSAVNSAAAHAIGSYVTNSEYFDGYLAETYFVDGQALTPSSFGAANADTGVWRPKAYTGTYGTNGFYLKFDNITSTTTLGNDSSGNGNNWTTNNISLTAGTTYDSMTDVPTLTSATVANYATLNPLKLYSTTAGTYSNANLSFSGPNTTNWYAAQSSITMSSGKWYFEATIVTATSSNNMVGIAPVSSTNANVGVESNTYAYMGANGNKQNNNTQTAYGATYTANDVIGVAFDATAGTLIFYKNNVSQGTAFTGITGEYAFTVACNPNTIAVNFGQRPFSYTPPTGYVALNTYNIPTSTIVKGNKYMDATTYTANGGVQTVTNTAAFLPDLVWNKTRSIVGGQILNDSVRGASKILLSNSTNAETTDANYLTSFNSNGFSLGSNNYTNGTTMVSWQWQAGQGSTSSNTSGSITSTVSVNASAGFSIVTYTGTGANATVGHGLGVAPSMIIVKKRSSTGNWQAWHTAFAGTQYITLNGTGVVTTLASMWNSTTPTSTVFSIGTDTDANQSTATYVAYCWAEIAGFSKFGKYTGNGSTDGTFNYLGFRPKFIMIKRTDTTGSWVILDTSRNTYNLTNIFLYPNLANADDTQAVGMDILSNGFKLRTSGAGENGSGGTFIYAAFAENPYKYSNAK